MPMRAQWDPTDGVGQSTIDGQHQALLDQCNVLADLCAGGGGDDADRRFDQAFDRLKMLAREHFETEASLLAGRDDAGLDDLRIERDEFEYFAAQIATTEHFDRLEVQRFVVLWCIGHIKGTAEHQRALFAGG